MTPKIDIYLGKLPNGVYSESPTLNLSIRSHEGRFMADYYYTLKKVIYEIVAHVHNSGADPEGGADVELRISHELKAELEALEQGKNRYKLLYLQRLKPGQKAYMLSSNPAPGGFFFPVPNTKAFPDELPLDILEDFLTVYYANSN